MSESNSLLEELIAEAQISGNEEAPSRLLDAIQLEDNPLQSINEIDAGNRLFDAITQEFGFIRHIRASGRELSQEERAQWVALLRWLIRELREWNVEDDEKYCKLTALFITACHSDFEDSIWTLLPAEIGDNANLLKAVGKLIDSCHCEVSAPAFVSHVPIWEKEAVETFQKADTEMDWPAVANFLRSLESRFIQSFFHKQAVRLLFRFGFDQLIIALSNIRTLDAIQVADTLTNEQKFQLGKTSDNPYVQFGCAYRALMWNKTALSDNEASLLSELLLKVSNNEGHWKRWLQVFNHYPVRFPVMQKSLGKALASSSGSALIAYVESIALSTYYNESRSLVGDCLQVFRQESALDHRQTLWRAAFKRWNEWSFQENEAEAHLFEISGCELDYAIVAYVVECMTDDEREAALEKLREKLQAIELNWYRDVSDLKTAWNRYLSQFQPFQHALQVGQDSEAWLVKDRQYLPYQDSDNYLKLMMTQRL